jgi:hypothetical protein
MTVEFKRNRILLRGQVAHEQAQALLDLLLAHPAARVDLAACTHLHAANLQLLIAARPAVAAWPKDQGLRPWLQAALKPEP